MQTHIQMKAPKRNQEGERQVVIQFRIGLNGNTVRSAPDVVKHAYDGVLTKGQRDDALEKEIENIDIDVFPLPESKKANIKLKGLYLQNLAVKKVKTSKGDTAIALTFEAEYEWNEVVWRWLGDVYKTDVFLEFDPAQASLLDIQDEEEEEDADQMELEADKPEEANGKAKGKGGRATSFNIEEFPSEKKTEAATGSE